MCDQTKRCHKCGEYKPIHAFHKDKNRKGGHSDRCAECVIAHVKNYYQTHRSETIQRAREWNQKNQVRRREIALAWGNKEVARLGDSYIRSKISESTGLAHNDIPQELVETKRVHMKIKRLITELNK